MSRMKSLLVGLIVLLWFCGFPATAAEPEFLWTYDAEVWITSTPLCTDDGRISFGCHDGTVRSIDSSGNLLRSFRTGDIVCASPIQVAPDRFAIGSADGRMYCLSHQTDLVWSYRTGGPIYGSVSVLSDGRMTFGSKDGRLYCLTNSGDLSWSFETGSWITATPAVRSDDVTLFGSWDGNFYALNPDGAVSWAYDAESPIAASASLDAQGSAYFGTLDGTLIGLDPGGQELFRFEVGDAILSTPTILPSGDLVFGANDGLIYWLGRDGTLKDTRRTDENVVAKPAISAQGELFVGSLDRNLYIANESGSRISSEEFPNAIIAQVSFLLDGTAIVACLDGRVHALPPRAGAVARDSRACVGPARLRRDRVGAVLAPPSLTTHSLTSRPESSPVPSSTTFRPTSLDEALFVMGCARSDLDQKHELYYQDDLRLAQITHLLDNPLDIPQFAYGIVHPLTPAPMDLQRMLMHLAERIDLVGLSREAFNMPLDATPLVSSIAYLQKSVGDPLTQGEIEELSTQAATLDTNLQKAAATIVYGAAYAYQLRSQSLSALDVRELRSLFGTRIMPFASSYTTTQQLDAVLTSAKKIDMSALVTACLKVLAAVEASLAHLAKAAAQLGDEPLFSFETPIGRIVIGGNGADTYGADDGDSVGYLLVIDTGGDDTYLGGSAGSTRSLDNGVSILLDLSGDDVYLSDGDFAQGCGNLGVGLVVDFDGDDAYRAANYSQGVGCCGVGMLCDLAGADRYFCESAGQGAACFGLGLCYDSVGDDEFYCVSTSQGFGFIKGIGVLDGGLGNDFYFSGSGQVDSREEEPGSERYDSMSQGFGWGYRNDDDRYFRSGGIGLINDGGGNDVYLADYFAQGSGYWFGAGVLYDRAGDDLYLARNYVQGSGTHTAIGVLVDDGGDDEYYAWAHAQGSGLDLSAGILIEELGNDYYSCGSTCQGVGVKNAFGLLCDSDGNDVFVASGEHQGMGRTSETLRRYGNVGLLLDFSGLDHYSDHSGQNRRWTDGYLGLTIDAETGSVPWKFELGPGRAGKDAFAERDL